MAKTRRLTALDLAYAAMFAALMAVGANIAQFIPPIGGVPITLQTFVATLAGALLGRKIGALSMIIYTLVGLVGVPVFAKFTGGPAILVSPNFGFILTFIIMAYVIGLIVEKSKKPGLTIFLVACFIGVFINYFFGTTYMYYAYKLWTPAPQGVSLVSYKMAWTWMLVPMPKDILLTIVAAIISPRIYKVVNQARGRLTQKQKGLTP